VGTTGLFPAGVKGSREEAIGCLSWGRGSLGTCNVSVTDEISVPVIGILRDALQGVKIHLDEAEGWPVAAGPLEIVQQRPDEIAADIDALGLSFLHRPDQRTRKVSLSSNNSA
jgi:hypothetical protein